MSMAKGEKGPFPSKPASIQTDGVYSTTLDLSNPDHRRGPTPYLGLQARLSQIWFNRWTVLLLLVLVKVLLQLGGLQENLVDAKAQALSACTKVEDVGSAMASMPHYLSVGVNHLAAKGITDAVHSLITVIDMILTGVEQIILFVINMMTSTYVCLLTAIVHAGLHISAFVVEKTTDEINQIIGGLADDIDKTASGVQSAIDEMWKAVSFFGGTSKPTIDVSADVKKLKNIHIDSTGFVADLEKLNKDLPDFDDVQRLTKNVISIPFNLVKKALNQSYGDWQFDNSIFPRAEKQALSFCSDNSGINEFFERLFKIARDGKTTFIVVISVLACLVCIPMAWWEVRRWRHQHNYRTLFQEKKYDNMDLMMMSARPFTSKIGLKVSDKLAGKNEKRRVLVRWAMAYGTSLPALFVLSLAIAGLFSCLCQWFILRAIEKEIPALADQVGDFAEHVVTTLEDASIKWAADANGVITTFNDEINNDVFGYVTNATDAVNGTLNKFTSLMETGLNDVFGKTVLRDPIEDVVHCLIGLKIEAIEKGLTWIHNHAKISLPLFPNDTFSAGAVKSLGNDPDMSSFLSSPGATTTDDVTGAVHRVTTALHNQIVQEALISLALLLIYLLIVFIGVGRMLLALAMPPQSYVENSRRGSNPPPVPPPTNGMEMQSIPLTPRSPGLRSRSEGPITRFSQFGMETRGPGAAHDDNGFVVRSTPNYAYRDVQTRPGVPRHSSYGQTFDSDSHRS